LAGTAPGTAAPVGAEATTGDVVEAAGVVGGSVIGTLTPVVGGTGGSVGGGTVGTAAAGTVVDGADAVTVPEQTTRPTESPASSRGSRTSGSGER
jgi:hypothetical protein